jgi:hypothetical protein
MRMLLKASLPHEPFNHYVRNGTAGETIAKIMETLRPEAAYFTEMDGHRTAIMIVNVEHPSQIPSIAEPFFLNFQADCHFHIVMSAEDLRKAELEKLGKKWG